MKSKQAKITMVSDISTKLAKSHSVVFADYQGLTMSQLSQLRNKLKDSQAEFSVTKNTLLKLALANAQLATDNLQSDNVFQGPIATLFAYGDEITPIKTLVKALKDFSKGRVKAGFLGTDYLDQYKIISLSQLPSKLELQGQVVGVLAAPLQGIVGVLNANLKGLVYALDQIRIQRGGE